MTTTVSTATDSTAATGVRSRLAAVALAASGVLIVVGHAMSVDSGGSPSDYVATFASHRTTAVLGGLMIAVGALLLLPGLVAALSLVRGRGAAFATCGAVLAGTGAAALAAGDVMLTLVMGTLVGQNADLARAIAGLADGGSAPLLALPFVFAPMLVLGLILLGVGLIRSRTVPVWQGALLVVGAVLIAASTGGGMLSSSVPLIPLGVALVLLAVRAARR